jgi:hypothetical protein
MGSGTRKEGAGGAAGEPEAVGKGGSGVRAVSLSPLASGGTFPGAGPESRLIVGSVPVEGRAGGRLPCWTGSRPVGISTLPLLTKTRAAGLATMTRGGIPVAWPDAALVLIGPVPTFEVAGNTGMSASEGSGAPFEGTMPVSGGALGVAKVVRSKAVLERLIPPARGGAGGRGISGLGRTSGSVLGRVVVPVSEADCFIWAPPEEICPVAGRVFCIGWVIAVDHAGGMFCEPVGLVASDAFIGNVAAVGLGGRGPIWEESGFSGRGGKLTRNVSRF